MGTRRFIGNLGVRVPMRAIVTAGGARRCLASAEQRLKPRQRGVDDGDAASAATRCVSVTVAGVLGSLIRRHDLVTAAQVADPKRLKADGQQAEGC